MDDLIDQIHYDHLSMSKVLNIMEEGLERIESDLDLDYGLMVEAMRYMIDYSDTVHHPKEDAIFDRLLKRAPDLEEIIGEIHAQHKAIAKLGNQFYSIVDNASLGEFVAKQDITKMGHDYIRTLRQHINLEEGDLLRKARKFLSDDDMDDIKQQYANYRDPLLSDSLEQEYTALYQSLINP